MKTYILLIFAMLIMAACSKKSNPTPVLSPANAKATDIVGKWTIVADTTFSNQSNSQFSVNAVTGDSYFQFNTDGTGTLGSDTESSLIPYNYTVVNGILTIVIPNPSGGYYVNETYSIYNITKNSLGLRLSNTNSTHEDAWLTK